MTAQKRDRGSPTRMHWLAFSLVAAVHCVLTFVFTLWSLGWQMLVLDTGGTTAPAGLKIVSAIDLLLALPVLLPLARLALYLGFADPVNDPIYWPLPILNSLLVAYAVTATMRWYAARRQVFEQRSAS
jgi:small-conductance mechanosensitive channel